VKNKEERTMNDWLNFTGKVALVTGAASGMGLATARAFAEAGAAVVLADVRSALVQTVGEKLPGDKLTGWALALAQPPD
jgi:NAD(P)-dependent dehydrogenase (short-subunit alcohol dehydrogenase family)